MIHQKQAIKDKKQIKSTSRQTILNLKGLINNSYDELTQKYEKSASLRESSLFQSYLSVIDHISEDVLREQKRYLNIDKQKMLDEKCVKLCQQIVLFRSECHRNKNLLKQVREQLRKQKQRGQVIRSQIDNLQNIEYKKQAQVQSNKSTWNDYLVKNQDIRSSLPQKLSLKIKRVSNISNDLEQMPVSKNQPFRRHSFTDKQPPLYMYKKSPKSRKHKQLLTRIFTLNLRNSQEICS